jgi:hypothetical protein
MNSDWTQLLELEGQGFIADTQTPSSLWLDQYIHGDDRPQVLAAIEQAIAKKTMFELEHRVRRVDGSLGWTLSRAVPLFDAEGEIVEWFDALISPSACKRKTPGSFCSGSSTIASKIRWRAFARSRNRPCHTPEIRLTLHPAFRAAFNRCRGCIRF